MLKPSIITHLYLENIKYKTNPKALIMALVLVALL